MTELVMGNLEILLVAVVERPSEFGHGWQRSHSAHDLEKKRKIHESLLALPVCALPDIGFIPGSKTLNSPFSAAFSSPLKTRLKPDFYEIFI